MITVKDYKAIADIAQSIQADIEKNRPMFEMTGSQVHAMWIARLLNYFKSTNYNFNASKFIDACTLSRGSEG